MRVMVILIVIGILEMIPKGLESGLGELKIGGQITTIETTAVLILPEYWEESWRLEETCCHSNSSKSVSANTGVENSQEV